MVGILTLILLTITGSVRGQCNGSPTLLTAGNSSGHLAFPEVNWDPNTGNWQPYQFYPTAVKCTWILRAPPSHVLAAAFLHFDTEQDYDFVTIYSSEDRSHQLLRASGDLTRDMFVTSPSDTMVVDLISDDYTTYYGFLLAYRYEPRACVEGGVTITENHLVALPPMNLQGVLPGPRLEKLPQSLDQTKFAVDKGGRVKVDKGGRGEAGASKGAEVTPMKWVPLSQYPPWVNCTWRVAVDSRNLVQLDILRFNTPEDDVMTIWQMNGDLAKPLLQYGGSDIPRTSFQSTKPLIITFLSQSSDRGSGFLLDVSYIMRACDPGRQKITSPRGLIGYPRHNNDQGLWRSQGLAVYGPDSCEWVISAPEGYAVNLTFLHFDTRQEDALKVMDGSSEVLSHSGGLPSRRNFVSRGPVLTLKFEPKEDTEKTGFLIQYSWLLKDCGSNLEDKTGEIRSPYYPDTYGSNVTCRWTITPPPGHLVHVLIARLRLDAGDALQVSDGVQDLKVTGSPHSSGRLFHLNPSPSANIFFSSDQRRNKGYFLLKYTSFRGGSCDFNLSPCGWRSTDPLQSWSFRGSEGLMAVAEESGLGMQFPRGYRSVLASPWITPRTEGVPAPGVPIPMCLRLDYLLDGPDAFLLTASLRQEGSTPGKVGPLQEEDMNLLSLYGPHGNKSLTTAINFTSTDRFQIWIQYERGYGPHYTVGVLGVDVSEGECGPDLDALTAVSCAFSGDFCGWMNTHTDHRNWLLTDRGIIAEVRSGSVSTHGSSRRSSSLHEQQWADLISPIVTSSELSFDLRAAGNSSGDCGSGDDVCSDDDIPVVDVSDEDSEGACLKIHYQLLSGHTELQVLIKKVHETRIVDHGTRGSHRRDADDVVLWTQGRVKSPDIMEALINVMPALLPEKYQIVLRALGVNEGLGGTIGVGGVKIHQVELHPGSCKIGPSCNFDNGFCSWSVSYTGRTVWYIKPHEDKSENGSHAAVSVEGGPDDTTSLTSDIISIPRTGALTFRYRVVGTSGCLSVGQRVVEGEEGSDYKSATTTNIWHQCRGKGLEWLRECVTLPEKTHPYQVVLTVGKGESTTEVWIDDVDVVGGGCNITHPPESPLPSLATPPQWDCLPEGSLCGMTQPKFGHRDWVYVQVTDEDHHRSTLPSHPTLSTPSQQPPQVLLSVEGRHAGFPEGDGRDTTENFCKDGTPLEVSWVCDGIPDCPDESDEENCQCDADAEGAEASSCVTPDVSLHLGGGVCAEGSFRCPSGQVCEEGDCSLTQSPCLPRERVCDGIQDCAGNEDEISCAGVGRIHPANDAVGNSGTMTCSGGLRIPSAWRCDSRKDCPLDGLDEVGCAYCGVDEFICPRSGVCVPQQQVCDGAPSLPSCTDETFCGTCPPGHFVCDICVASWQICDGVWDCEEGEDERECAGVGGGDKCEEGHYSCPSGHCLPSHSVCDRRIDCADGDDERHCLDDNVAILRYISVKPSPVSGSGRWGKFASRLVTPPLSHPAGGVGVLSFKYRLDAWIGPSNATLSVEMVDNNDADVGLRRWALWRQSGHKGNQWLSNSVLIPAHLRESYRVSFIVSRDEHVHDSQQLHLAQLTYRVVLPAALMDLGTRLSHCEFSDSLCGWSQPSPVGGYSWVFARASPHSRRTGPITGYPDGGESGFIFADSLYGSEGSTADLLSPPLLLPQGQNPALCFRFAVFLFGAHVAKVSVHVLQRVGDAVHTAELYHAVGGMGLSWVSVGVNIGLEELADPRLPMILVIRATRGSGPEGDIALDHLSILSGSCLDHPVVDPNVTLSAIYHPDAHAISAGPAITPMPTHDQIQGSGSYQLDDECGRRGSCMECVGEDVDIIGCTWCDLSQICISSISPAASACPHYLTIHHNTSDQQTRRGPVWCPQLLPQVLSQQETEVLVVAGSTPILNFPVVNIQSSQTDNGWVCVFEPVEEEVEVKESDDEEREGQDGGATEEEALKEAMERRLQLVEELELRKKRKSELKKIKKGRKGTKEGSMKLPGRFQGRVYDVGEGVGSGVGVGNIRCGDGTTELRPTSTNSQTRYDVHLITPSAAVLDNPSRVRLVVYSCDSLASSCSACVGVNASFECGWCEVSDTCTTHAHCGGNSWIGPGRSCYSDDHPKKLLRDAQRGSMDEEEGLLVGLGEPLEKPLGEHLGSPVDPLEFSHDYEEYPPLARPGLEFETMDNMLDSPQIDVESDDEEGQEGRGGNKDRRNKGQRKKNKRKKNQKNLRSGDQDMDDEASSMVNDSGVTSIGRLGGSKKAGRKPVKGEVRVRSRGRAFLRLPQHPGLFIARDDWRLHTGRQYYVPVAKKTLINLGFVRQVIYGSLAEEKSRTVLVNGAWKKAAGYFVDLFEKVDHDPVTSLITTSRRVFEQLLVQLTPAETD